MAAKITPEKIEQINELYAEIGVKSKVAKLVGCSPATVTKYLIPDYVPVAQRNVPKVHITVNGPDALIERVKKDFTKQCLFESTMLTLDEWKELREMQKNEIFM